MLARNVEDQPFGVRLRAVREALGLSQEGLARRAGLTREEVNKIENGRNKGRSARIQKALGGALGLPADYFSSFYAGGFPVANVLHFLGVHVKVEGLFPGHWSGSTWAAEIFAGPGSLKSFSRGPKLPERLDAIEKALRKILGERLVPVDALDPGSRALLREAIVERRLSDVLGTDIAPAGTEPAHSTRANRPKR